MMGRMAKSAVLVIVAISAVSLGLWAGSVVFAPPQVSLDAPLPVTYRVEVGTVGRSLRFVAVASWPTELNVRYPEGGTVTSRVVLAGDEVKTGAVLFAVDLRPVVAAEGSVPAFRTLRRGDQGDDVAQMERLLVDLGFLENEPDGIFDDALRQSVREWQRSLGIEPDGVVHLGDVLFLPMLPVRVVPTDAIEVGALLTPGGVVFLTVGDAPDFVIPLASDQRNLVPLSGSVVIDYDGGTWQGRIESARENPERGGLSLLLASLDGKPLCGTECVEAVPVGDSSDFPVEIVVVPETTGPQIPVAAILTALDGSTMVELETGELRSIDIVATANGLAIVEGVEAGTVIVLPQEAN